ncbi:transcriptional regulator [Litoribrevibacter albus]|nr:YdaS family helix-turn-helix protein [Litoribrevibacter albus]
MQRLLEVFESKQNIAELVGITPAAAGRWFKTGQVPAKQVLKIEKLSNGELHCSDIRPDLYPPERFKSV